MNTYRYNRPKIVAKLIHQLEGAAAAIIYDGCVDDSEISFLKGLIADMTTEVGAKPFSAIADVLTKILADGLATPQERSQLMRCLANFAPGPKAPKTIDGVYVLSPRVEFTERSFLFSGQLRYAERDKAEAAVVVRGGTIARSVCRTLDYLVVGELGSPEWKYGRYGTKIEKAMELRQSGHPLPALLKEQHFVEAIIGGP